jgi:purine-nucleoside phosphorylase
LGVGSICVVKDHINYSGRNPLIGKNFKDYGDRFPDMSESYSKEMILKAKKIKEELKIEFSEENCFYTSSRMYFSKNEFEGTKKTDSKLISSLGIIEVILARHSKINVFSVGVVTNQLHHEKDDDKVNSSKLGVSKLIQKIIE